MCRARSVVIGREGLRREPRSGTDHGVAGSIARRLSRGSAGHTVAGGALRIPAATSWAPRYALAVPSASRATIGLFGAFGVGNMGNDQSGRTMIRLIEELGTDLRVVAVSREARRAQEALGVQSFALDSGQPHGGALGRVASKVRGLRHLTQLVGRFDQVVVPGTGLLEQTSGRLPGGDLTWTALLSLACRLKRVPLAWFGMGGSATMPPLPRVVAWLAANGVQFLSFRDEMSALSLGQGLRNRSIIVPDIVFATPDERVRTGPTSPETRPTIGVAVINYDPPAAGDRERYLEEMSALVERLLARGTDLRLLLGDEADESPTREVLASVTNRGGDLTGVSVVPFGAFEELAVAAARCDLVVASRYHVLLAASLTATPLIAVSHASKDDALMQQLGQDRYVIPAPALRVDAALALIDTALADADGIRECLERRVESFRTEVVHAFAASGIGSTLEATR